MAIGWVWGWSWAEDWNTLLLDTWGIFWVLLRLLWLLAPCFRSLLACWSVSIVPLLKCGSWSTYSLCFFETCSCWLISFIATFLYKVLADLEDSCFNLAPIPIDFSSGPWLLSYSLNTTGYSILQLESNLSFWVDVLLKERYLSYASVFVFRPPVYNKALVFICLIFAFRRLLVLVADAFPAPGHDSLRF